MKTTHSSPSKFHDDSLRLYFSIAAQIAQVAQSIWIALAGQPGQQYKKKSWIKLLNEKL